MNHRAFIASLSPAQRAALTQRSDSAGLRQLALHFAAIAATGGCLAANSLPLAASVALSLTQGVLLVFLFPALHETVHGTPFATRWLNTAVGWTCGFVLLLPADWFRYFHLAHHRHTQDPDNDPELATPKPDGPAALALYLSGLPVWWDHTKTLGRNAFADIDDGYVPASERARLRRNSRRMLLGYASLAAASVATGSTLALELWIVPALLGQPFLRLYLAAEHGGCPHTANAFENTRTTFTNRFVRALAWNMPFHAEHHAWPGVPFHRLPEVHALMRPQLRVTERGYWRFSRQLLRILST